MAASFEDAGLGDIGLRRRGFRKLLGRLPARRPEARMPAAPDDRIIHGVLAAVAAFRWAAWAWMAIVLLIHLDELRRPLLALVLVGGALAVTVAATVGLRVRPSSLVSTGFVSAELAVAVALVLGDGVVYGPGHVFSGVQGLGVAWPLAAVISAGIAYGAWAGLGAGLVVGASRYGAAILNGLGTLTGTQILSVLDTSFTYALAGGVAGYGVGLLVRARFEVAEARAREEVARTLHDGVLQTLAVIERRSDDPDLVRLVRRQDRELRRFLFGYEPAKRGGTGVDLHDELSSVAARFEEAYGGRVVVTVADDIGALPQRGVDAIKGAVAEALNNAGRHGAAERVTIYVEPDADRGIFCSVKDDGRGFDGDVLPAGVGVTRSIKGRLEELGGRAEVESRPERGTEVRLWLPCV